MFWGTTSLYIFTSSAVLKIYVSAKYTVILYTKTSHKLFIIKLLLKKETRQTGSVQITNCPNIAVYLYSFCKVFGHFLAKL